MWMWRFLLPFSLCSCSFRSEIILECNFISTISIWQLLWQALIFFCLVGAAMFSIKNCNWNWIGKSHLKVLTGLVKPYFIYSYVCNDILQKYINIFAFVKPYLKKGFCVCMKLTTLFDCLWTSCPSSHVSSCCV